MSTATLKEAKKTIKDVAPLRPLPAHELPFDQIMRRYGGMVYNTCLGITRNAHDAEDATQATFLTLAMHLQSARTIQYLGPWLEQVATRAALNLIRSRKRRDRRENIVAAMRPPETVDADRIDADEIRAAVREELNAIPARYRMPLILHYFGQNSTEEVARELGITANALGVRLHRGRQMLRQRLRRRGISISAVGLGIVLAQMVRVTIYEQMVQPVAQTAAALAAGQATVPPAVGTHVIAMAQGAMKPMLGGRIKVAALLVVLAAGSLTAATRLTALGNTLKENLLHNPIESIKSALPNPLDLRVEADTRRRVPEAAPRPVLPPADVPRTEFALRPQPNPHLPMSAPGPRLLPPVRMPDAPAAHRSAPLPRPRYYEFAPLASRPSGSAAQDPTFVIPQTGATRPAPITRDDRFRAAQTDLERYPLALGPMVDAQPITAGPDWATNSPPGSNGKITSPEPIAAGIPLRADRMDYVWPRDHVPLLTSSQSIEFRFHGLTQPGLLAVREVDRTLHDELFLPEGHTFATIWSMASASAYTSLDLLVHYDEMLLRELGLDEANLKLWIYDDGLWQRIDAGRNTDQNTIWGTTTDGQYIAISTPEPTAMALGAFAAGYTLLRRRRRDR